MELQALWQRQLVVSHCGAVSGDHGDGHTPSAGKRVQVVGPGAHGVPGDARVQSDVAIRHLKVLEAPQREQDLFGSGPSPVGFGDRGTANARGARHADEQAVGGVHLHFVRGVLGHHGEARSDARSRFDHGVLLVETPHRTRLFTHPIVVIVMSVVVVVSVVVMVVVIVPALVVALVIIVAVVATAAVVVAVVVAAVVGRWARGRGEPKSARKQRRSRGDVQGNFRLGSLQILPAARKSGQLVITCIIPGAVSRALSQHQVCSIHLRNAIRCLWIHKNQRGAQVIGDAMTSDAIANRVDWKARHGNFLQIDI